MSFSDKERYYQITTTIVIDTHRLQNKMPVPVYHLITPVELTYEDYINKVGHKWVPMDSEHRRKA